MAPHASASATSAPRGRNARKVAGCPGALVHDMRRSAVRTFERAGVPRSVVMSIVGHKTESIYRRSAIVDEAMQREAAPDEARRDCAKCLGESVSSGEPKFRQLEPAGRVAAADRRAPTGVVRPRVLQQQEVDITPEVSKQREDVVVTDNCLAQRAALARVVPSDALDREARPRIVKVEASSIGQRTYTVICPTSCATKCPADRVTRP